MAQVRTCPECGEALAESAHHLRVYCSRKCLSKFHDRKRTRDPQVRSEQGLAYRIKSGRIRFCPCGARATNRKAPPRCDTCRAEAVRLAQQRYRDKERGSYQRGIDEPACIWCGTEMNPRPHEVLGPKKFCSDRCRGKYGNEQRRARTALERRCSCGRPTQSRTGVPLCVECLATSKAKQARRRVLRVYGLTEADYDRLLIRQNGQCAVCKTTDPGRAVFSVDHCHESGQVRGLLCLTCNAAIGLLKDDPAIVKSAMQYLERTSQLPLAVGS